MKTTIYIITHKKFNEPKLEDYKPLQVGFQNDLGYLRDNKGDNISDKNKNYCELTGLYWIWKNDKKSDILGSIKFYLNDKEIHEENIYGYKNEIKENNNLFTKIGNFFKNLFN